MLRYLSQYRFYITLFLFLLVPVLAIDTSTRSPRDYRFSDRVIVSVTSPLQSLITLGLDQLVAAFQNYVFLLDTRRDNLALIEENRRLLNEIAGFRETSQENIRLRSLLGFKESFRFQGVLARVIAKDASTEFRSIRINRGSDYGVRKNMAVVTQEGVVGRVLRVTATSADVLTLLDPLSGVDALVERSRARGVVQGLTEEVCNFRYVLRTDDIVPGDVLVSSGLGGIFPKGLPVGVVSQVNRKAYGISQQVEVRPSVDFSKLEEVLVITETTTEVGALEALSEGRGKKAEPNARTSEGRTTGP